MVEYDKSSPYYQTSKRSFYLDVWKPRSVPSSSDDRIVMLEQKHKERPDILAYELYGNTRYWWVFAVRNPNTIKDPIWDFQPGVEIYVPSRTSLESNME